MINSKLSKILYMHTLYIIANVRKSKEQTSVGDVKAAPISAVVNHRHLAQDGKGLATVG